MLKPFVVLVNTDDVYNHNIVVYARQQDDALEQACVALRIPFNHVTSATVTPQRREEAQA